MATSAMRRTQTRMRRAERVVARARVVRAGLVEARARRVDAVAVVLDVVPVVRVLRLRAAAARAARSLRVATRGHLRSRLQRRRAQVGTSLQRPERALVLMLRLVVGQVRMLQLGRAQQRQRARVVPVLQLMAAEPVRRVAA